MEISGVIDRFEGEYAVIVFDDEQQLDWPRDRLPASVRPGQTVNLTVQPTDELQAAGQPEGGWSGQQHGGKITMADGQTLTLPTSEISAAAETETAVTMLVEADEAATQARQARVKSLLDDIFNQKKD
jgi:hypothetical protein